MKGLKQQPHQQEFPDYSHSHMSQIISYAAVAAASAATAAAASNNNNSNNNSSGTSSSYSNNNSNNSNLQLSLAIPTSNHARDHSIEKSPSANGSSSNGNMSVSPTPAPAPAPTAKESSANPFNPLTYMRGRKSKQTTNNSNNNNKESQLQVPAGDHAAADGLSDDNQDGLASADESAGEQDPPLAKSEESKPAQVSRVLSIGFIRRRNNSGSASAAGGAPGPNSTSVAANSSTSAFSVGSAALPTTGPATTTSRYSFLRGRSDRSAQVNPPPPLIEQDEHPSAINAAAVAVSPVLNMVPTEMPPTRRSLDLPPRPGGPMNPLEVYKLLNTPLQQISSSSSISINSGPLYGASINNYSTHTGSNLAMMMGNDSNMPLSNSRTSFQSHTSSMYQKDPQYEIWEKKYSDSVDGLVREASISSIHSASPSHSMKRGSRGQSYSHHRVSDSMAVNASSPRSSIMYGGGGGGGGQPPMESMSPSIHVHDVDASYYPASDVASFHLPSGMTSEEQQVLEQLLEQGQIPTAFRNRSHSFDLRDMDMRSLHSKPSTLSIMSTPSIYMHSWMAQPPQAHSPLSPLPKTEGEIRSLHALATRNAAAGGLPNMARTMSHHSMDDDPSSLLLSRAMMAAAAAASSSEPRMRNTALSSRSRATSPAPSIASMHSFQASQGFGQSASHLQPMSALASAAAAGVVGSSGQAPFPYLGHTPISSRRGSLQPPDMSTMQSSQGPAATARGMIQFVENPTELNDGVGSLNPVALLAGSFPKSGTAMARVPSPASPAMMNSSGHTLVRQPSQGLPNSRDGTLYGIGIHTDSMGIPSSQLDSPTLSSNTTLQTPNHNRSPSVHTNMSSAPTTVANSSPNQSAKSPSTSGQSIVPSQPVPISPPTLEQLVHPDRTFSDLDALVSDIVKRMLYREENDDCDHTAHLSHHPGRRAKDIHGEKEKEKDKEQKESKAIKKAPMPPANHAHITLNIAGAPPPPPMPAVPSGWGNSYMGGGGMQHQQISAPPMQLTLRVLADRVETKTRLGQVKSRIEFRRVVEIPPGAPTPPAVAAIAAVAAGGNPGNNTNNSNNKGEQTSSVATPGNPPVYPTYISGSSQPNAPGAKSNMSNGQTAYSTQYHPRLIVGPVMGRAEEPSLADEVAAALEACAEETGCAALSVTVRSFVDRMPAEAGDGSSGMRSNSANVPGSGGWFGGADPCGASLACGGDVIHEIWGYHVGPAEICPCGRHLAEGCRMYKLRKEVVAWVCSSNNGLQGGYEQHAYGAYNKPPTVWQLPFERYI